MLYRCWMMSSVAVLVTSSSLIAGPLAAQSADVEPFSALVRQAQLASGGRHWANAADLWRNVVDRNPTVASYWAELGQSLYEGGRFEESIAAYARAMELGAGYPWSSPYAIARAQARLNRVDSALAWLDTALRLRFRDLDQIRNDSVFASFRSNPRFRALAAMADPKSMSRLQGWTYDVDLFDREIRRLHYSPFLRTPEPEFRAAVAALKRDLPKLSDPEIKVRLMRLATMAGDGHTTFRAVRIPDGTTANMPMFEAAPVLLYDMSGGLYVVGSDSSHADLVGWEVIRVAGREPREVLAAIDPLVSWDNRGWIKLIAPDYARRPGLLNALGMTRDRDSLRLRLRSADGRERDVALATDLAASDQSWLPFPPDSSKPLYLRDRRKAYWFTYLADSRTVYFQYNRVRPDPTESMPQFLERLFGFIDSNQVDRLVIDLRWNRGGNTFMHPPLLERLIASKLNATGKLFVIIGRNTFSAAQNGATMIERMTRAVFVGEPTGSRPNFIGESIRLTLPYSGLTASISDLYWQTSWPMDHRTWIGPTLYAPPTIEAFRTGRDPAMEAILAYRP